MWSGAGGCGSSSEHSTHTQLVEITCVGVGFVFFFNELKNQKKRKMKFTSNSKTPSFPIYYISSILRCTVFPS